MKRWLKPLFLLLGLVWMQVASAHENTPPEIPPITQRCVTIENNPPDDWTFEGTIVTFGQGDGVYGFRSDFESRYYIAFDSDSAFGISGSLSPNGLWFAYFAGRREYYNMVDPIYYATELRVVSTQPTGENYAIPFNGGSEVGTYPLFSTPVWLDNTELAVYSDSLNSWSIAQPFTKIISQASDQQASEFKRSLSSMRFSNAMAEKTIPANPPRIFSMQIPEVKYYSPRLYITDLSTHQIYNTCIQLGDTGGGYAYAVSPSGDQIAVSIGGEDGFVYVFDLEDWTAYRLDLAANAVIAWVADP